MSGQEAQIMDFKALYNALRKQRLEAGFIQESIAAHCGVTIHLVRKWLSGKATIRPPYIKLLASFNINDYKV